MLVIGIYNETMGLSVDIDRVNYERDKIETKAVWQVREILTLTVDTLTKISPNCFKHCMLHSEAGLLYNRAFETMNPDQQQKIQEELHVTALGPAEMVPKKYAKFARNFYSESDHITKHLNKSKFNSPKYNVQLLPCKIKWGERTAFLADHNFNSLTYQDALQDQIYEYKKNWRSMNENTR